MTVTEPSMWIVTVDVLAEAGQRFVDRVVDDFVDEMVQAGRTGRPDVHRRALPNRLESLEDLDLVGAVVVCASGHNRPWGRRGLAVLIQLSV